MGKDAPEAPNPTKVAKAQADANIATAQEQARLAMTGQVTPTGSLQYVVDPTSPSGYRAVQTLSPEEQALMGQSQDLRAQYGGIAGEQLGRVGDTFADPFDLTAERGTEISDVQRTFLDPMWADKERSLQADLLNRGIRPGSEAYAREMAMFSDQKSSAYDRMFLDAWGMANNAALTERNIPLTDLAALGIGAFPGQTPGINPTATPTPGVAPTDVIGPTYNSYNAQMNASNNQMGGLFGLGASALGGWAQAGFPGVAAGLAMLSDRRVKESVKKIGDDPRGWGVYVFRYALDGLKELGWRIGFMAQEVEKKRPEAVIVDPSTGFKMVNYDALAMA
jgi:hypothetical protein